MFTTPINVAFHMQTLHNITRLLLNTCDLSWSLLHPSVSKRILVIRFMSLLSTEHLQLGCPAMPIAKQAVCKQLGGRKWCFIVGREVLTATWCTINSCHTRPCHNKLDRKLNLYSSRVVQCCLQMSQNNPVCLTNSRP